MPFRNTIRAVLENYATSIPPKDILAWSEPWISILTTLFPSTQGHIIHPIGCISNSTGPVPTPEFVIEVLKLSDMANVDDPPYHTVLFVRIKNTPHPQNDIAALKYQICDDAAFASTPCKKLYWLESIGPHWRYSVEVEGQKSRPLIRWHHATHDEASFNDLQALARLVAESQV